MRKKLNNLFLSIIRALLCDKDKDGSITSNPSFAKFAFWLILAWFLPKPTAFNQYWFYVVAALLAYILFGTKFLPAFFASKKIAPEFD